MEESLAALDEAHDAEGPQDERLPPHDPLGIDGRSRALPCDCLHVASWIVYDDPRATQLLPRDRFLPGDCLGPLFPRPDLDHLSMLAFWRCARGGDAPAPGNQYPPLSGCPHLQCVQHATYRAPYRRSRRLLLLLRGSFDCHAGRLFGAAAITGDVCRVFGPRLLCPQARLP